MSRSQFQSAVLQFTVIRTLRLIFTHELRRNGFTDILEDPVVKNLTTAFTHNTPHATLSNTTLSNTTSTIPETSIFFFENPKSFYFSMLPREMFICILLFPLAYYWQILLERAFPTRPRRREILYPKEKEITATADQEEQIVKRWIDQGKVQRSSILWWNTFLKWILDTTIGNLWYGALTILVSSWIHFGQSLENFKLVLFLNVVQTIFTFGTLSSLISFIVMPVSKRVVFVEGLEAIEDFVSYIFLLLIVPMILKGEWVQDIMRNMTISMMTPPVKEPAGIASGRLTIDEL